MKTKILARLRRVISGMFTGEGTAFPPQDHSSLQESSSTDILPVDRNATTVARVDIELPPSLPCNFYSEF